MVTVCAMAATLMQALDVCITWHGAFLPGLAAGHLIRSVGAGVTAVAGLPRARGRLASNFGLAIARLRSRVTLASALCGMASSLTEIAFRLPACFRRGAGAAVGPHARSVSARRRLSHGDRAWVMVDRS
jgi:hypothetical protein